MLFLGIKNVTKHLQNQQKTKKQFVKERKRDFRISGIANILP
jgi:hypothetical protein